MTGHLVEQTETSTHVHLMCRSCDFTAAIGHTRPLDHGQRVALQPLVTLVRWAHQDPSLLAGDAAGESVERSVWRRVRSLMRGVAP